MLFQDLVLLVLFFGRAVAEPEGPDPEKDLAQIANAQSVVVGNYFYTIGGYATFNVPDSFPFGIKRGGVTQVTTSNGYLRRIDLTRPFTVTKIDTVPEQSIPLSDEVPRMHSGTMWAHNTTIYLGPGNLEGFPQLYNRTWTNHNSLPLRLRGIWTYDTAKPDAGWVRFPYLGSTSQFNLLTGGSVAYLDDTAYIMGGTSNQTYFFREPDGGTITPPRSQATQGPPATQELGVMFDLLFKLNIERNVIRNETSSIGQVSSGRMVSIKGAGKKGILVYIGGLGPNGFNDMSTVRVYDIASSTWKTQKATSQYGSTPQGRTDFCAVALSAQDYTSHQIYFYGGYSSASGTSTPLDDVWVLTLPSFQFIWAGSTSEAGRASGTCGVISPQYLLAYRGESYMRDETVNRLGDALLALLDLTDLKWKTEYTPASASTVYRVPQRVIEMIGGDETGNATATAPSGGFDDESLAAVFNISDSKMPAPSFSASDPSSPSARKSSIPESPYTAPPKNQVVIGVSITCTAVAFLSIGGITLLIRRRQRNKLQALAEKLGPKPWERLEADGKMVVPVKYELEGSRPVVHEIGGP